MTVLSPLADPPLWTPSLPGVLPLPDGTRHAGALARVLRCTAVAATGVRVPAAGVVRMLPLDADTTVVELTVNPFPVRRTVLALPGGLPTLYLVVPATDLVLQAGFVAAGAVVADTTDLRLLAVHQDRVCRDPTRWVPDLLAALTAAGQDGTSWAAFVARVAPLAAADDAPVLLLDHAGAPVGTDGPYHIDVVLTGAGATHRVILQPGDGGDLQKAMARAAAAPGGPARGDLLGAAASLRPLGASRGQLQIAADTGESAAGLMGITRARRTFTTTDLHSWFAAQRAIPAGATAPALARFSRGNHLRLYTRGSDYFQDLMRSAAAAGAAEDPDGQFHLAGWSIDHKLRIAAPAAGDPPDLPVTVLDAAKAVAATGRARFLAPELLQIEPNAPAQAQEIWAVIAICSGLLVLSLIGDGALVDLDGSGRAIICCVVMVNPELAAWALNTAGAFEQNVPAVDALGALAGGSAALTAYPATLDDNVVAPSSAGFPFDTLLRSVRKFGVHHTKLAVVRWTGKDGVRHDVAYCGGIDVWEDRLDDERHLSAAPFHDVHARVEGPAARDLAVTFAEYHNHEVAAPQERVPDLPDAGTFRSDGTVAVQVARTYFAAVAGSGRAFPFAPDGDRTLADTLLAAIGNARELIYIEDQYLTPPLQYRTALLDKVGSGDLRALVIVIPALADQPFAQTIRDPFVQALHDAAATARCAVRVGYPRLRHVVADNQARAASGRCRLLAPIDATAAAVALGPAARVPAPPFWVSIGGELLYAYDEAPAALPDGHVLRVLRGAATGFLRGSGPPTGPRQGGRPRAHTAGSAATVVDFPSVYVHAKLMIVDDVFLSVGSANLNRRGLFHDGETNVFAVPQALRCDPANPVAALRAQLWAKVLDLPHDLAAPLLADPLRALDLFDRSPFAGNRFAPLSAYPEQLMFGAATGDGLVGTLLQLGAAGSVAANHRRLFDAAVDPSSATENR